MGSAQSHPRLFLSGAVAYSATQEDAFVGVAKERFRKEYHICNIRADLQELFPQESTAVDW